MAIILLALFLIVSVLVVYLFVGPFLQGRYVERSARFEERNHRRRIEEQATTQTRSKGSS